MNLNKYDAQGFLYTAEEAAERAHAIFGQRLFYPGYKRQVYPVGHLLAGLPAPEPKVLPYNVGRNAKKRARKAAWANLLRGIRHV